MRKVKPREGIDEKTWRLALEVWYHWYLSHVLPPTRIRTATGDKEGEENVYEVFARSIRGNTEHSDGPLARIIADEDRGTGWPASIHAIILDMPPLWQLIVLGSAAGRTQQRMAEDAGVSQPGISAALSLVKSRFLTRLRLIGATQGRLAQMTRASMPPAMAHRSAVVD